MPWNNGKEVPRWGVAEIQKWVPQQLGDVNKQWNGDSRPMGSWHGDAAANHTDLQSGCGRTCVFAVQVWSNLWELIWLRTSHYSMTSRHFSVIVKTDGSVAALVQCLVWCVGCILVDCISRLHKNISTYFVFCEKKVVLQLLATWYQGPDLCRDDFHIIRD